LAKHSAFCRYYGRYNDNWYDNLANIYIYFSKPLLFFAEVAFLIYYYQTIEMVQWKFI